jgi:hypothetical protein
MQPLAIIDFFEEIGKSIPDIRQSPVFPVPIPLIPPFDSEGIRHPIPIQSAGAFRLILPPLVGA